MTFHSLSRIYVTLITAAGRRKSGRMILQPVYCQQLRAPLSPELRGPYCFGGEVVGSRAKLRVPNPKKPVKGRLDAPAERVHPVKKRYRRRPKHPERGEA